MNRDDAFELQLARWLEDGPREAPSGPVVAALAAIRAHPERARAHGSLWRHLVSGIPLTHVPAQPGRGWATVAVAAVVLVMAAGYGFLNLGGQGGPAASPAPTPTPVVTPAPKTPTPTLGPGMATGTQSCPELEGEVATTVDGVIQTRGGVMRCTHTSTDPRLSGTASVSMDIDEHPDGLWLGWGAIELRNSGGAWAGTYTVTSRSSASSMEFDSAWLGSGGYEGLEVLNHVRVTATRVTITSRVFTAGLAITGTETCSVVAPGTEWSADGMTHQRGLALRCTDTMTDPRAAGERSVTLSVDTRPDESADLWGSSILENDLGTWEGRFFGTVDAGYTTHRIHALMNGRDGLEGLFFRLEVVGSGEPDYQLAGEIIQGF